MSAEPALRAALLQAGDRMPPPLVPSDLWARARRERRHRRVRRAVVAVAVAAVAALGAPLLIGVPPIPSPASTPDHVTGYPMRIGHQWIVTDLPAAPGPIVALVQTVRHERTADQPTGWLAVSPSGRLWRIPLGDGRTDTYPVLSHDGRYLAYLSSRTKSFVIADLVSGRLTRFSDVGGGATVRPDQRPTDLPPYWVQDQSPGYFSPDDRHVLYLGGSRPDHQGGAVVLDRMTGFVQALFPSGDRFGDLPIGFSGADAMWWLTPHYPTTLATQPSSVTLRVVSLEGQTLRTVSLPARTWQPNGLGVSQWSGPISPDGTMLAAPSGVSGTPGVYQWWIDAGDASPGDTFVGVPGLESPCGLGWSAGRVIVPTTRPDGRGGATVLLDGDRQRTVSVVSPRLGPSCVMWAGDALAAGPTGPHPFGVSTAAWTWWWQEILAGTVAVLFGVAAVVGLRRRARRP